MKMWQAAAKVLGSAGRPLTLDEIYSRIVAENLFEFGARDPKGALRRQIHRHCREAHDCKPGAEYFVRLSNTTYKLVPKSS